jgi:outer membrane protein OmpA-like peptidoglycan-associated protein
MQHTSALHVHGRAVFEHASPAFAILKRESLAVMVVAFLGCLLCTTLTRFVGLPATASSAILGLGVSAFAIGFRLPVFVSLAAFAGTFGGMATIPADSGWSINATLLAATVAISVWIFHALQARYPHVSLAGIGGRLGVFAFVGVWLFNALFPYRLLQHHDAALSIVGLAKSAIWIFLGATVTAMLRCLLSRNSPHLNVLASSTIGLAGSLPLICHMEDIGGLDVGQRAAAAIYLGSFIGMSDLTYLRSNLLIISSVISAVLLELASTWLAGWGGLLGTVSACSVMLSRVLDGPPNPEAQFKRLAVGLVVSAMFIGSIFSAIRVTGSVEYASVELPRKLAVIANAAARPARVIADNGAQTGQPLGIISTMMTENEHLSTQLKVQVAENMAIKFELSELRDHLGALEKDRTEITTTPKPYNHPRDHQASAQVAQFSDQRRCGGTSATDFTTLTLPFQRYQETLNSGHIEQLARVATLAQECRNITIIVSGFTDSRGSGSANKRLSTRRAELAAEYLRQRDIDLTRISVKGFGSSSPVDSNASIEGRAKNRRVEVRALYELPVLRHYE